MFSSRYEKEPGDTGSKELGVASAYLSGLDEFRGFGCCLFESQAIEAPNVASRPRQEFVTRSAVGIEVAFVLYRFISLLFVAKVQTTALRVGEIVLSNPHVLRAGVVKSGVQDVCAAGRAGNDRKEALPGGLGDGTPAGDRKLCCGG